MASGEKTQSDVESDEEFDELISNEHRQRYFGVFDAGVVRPALVIQLRKNRLDRVEKILEIRFADPNFLDQWFVIYTVLSEGFKRMPVRGCSQLLRIILRYGATEFTDFLQLFAVRKAVFYEDKDSLDTLREFLGNSFVNQMIAQEQERFRSRSELLSASLRGDLAEVDRLLVEEGSNRPGWTGYEMLPSLECDDLDPIAAAAELGHTDVVKRLLFSSARHPQCLDFDRGHFNHGGLWSIACRRSNLEMAVHMLSTIDISWFLRNGMDCLLSHCIESTPEFFRDVLSLIRTRRGEAGLKFTPEWLSETLNYAIWRQRRKQVAILLDEIDQDRSLFNWHPWTMRSILHWRSAAILRDVLIRYPEAPANNPDCDPLLAIQDYHWPVGARLLVEAGAKIQGKVPPYFAGLLSLSLEDKCRIVVRRHMKLPLSQNVGRLPLPGKVKQRLLYR